MIRFLQNLKGRRNGGKGMFTKVSDNVLVTIKREDDGLKICTVAKINGRTIFSERSVVQK